MQSRIVSAMLLGATQSVPARKDVGGSFHVNLGMGNLVDVVEHQSRAWTSRRRSYRPDGGRIAVAAATDPRTDGTATTGTHKSQR